MKHKIHLVVIDAIAFNGGSKVATQSILRQLDSAKVSISILTADKQAWTNPSMTKVPLYELPFLANKEQGLAYFLRHFIIAINLLLLRVRLGHIDITVGASGPGVDLAMYMLKPLLKTRIVQFIHGPVATSRTICRCLNHAEQVYYLHSTRASLQKALQIFTPLSTTLPAHFFLFENGLCDQSWPTRCQTHSPVIFWAASLLKWKGLDLFVEALTGIDAMQRPLTHICYIKPQSTILALSDAPVPLTNVHWYESPSNLDEVRARANIFVSSSDNEPFGLSILEAMAAAMCVLIPDDGAYWDNLLENKVNCIKYRAGDSHDLQQKLLMLSNDLPLLTKVGLHASKLALNYRASTQYQFIKNNIEKLCLEITVPHLVNG
ncbi:glycosyltransferase family 4 protein [Psychromonas hadalis]|uniref:glycosyltransferase family 4 protein n=1 Tax=Psychromonas hadalis TaxID=211669 RepID=UPI0003B5A5A0|nr:glycosyltransferase family 4 protein [Psychromonas hadalis]